MKKINSLCTLFLLLFFFLLQQSCFAQKALPKNAVDPKRIHISWDTSTLRHVANGGYARMVELKNSRLITVYAASNGNTEIVYSDDKGDHWSEPIIVAARSNNIRMDAPDIIILKDGSLMVCYNSRPGSRNQDSSKHFGIGIVKSNDNGLTWKDNQLLYEAGF